MLLANHLDDEREKLSEYDSESLCFKLCQWDRLLMGAKIHENCRDRILQVSNRLLNKIVSTQVEVNASGSLLMADTRSQLSQSRARGSQDAERDYMEAATRKIAALILVELDVWLTNFSKSGDCTPEKVSHACRGYVNLAEKLRLIRLENVAE